MADGFELLAAEIDRIVDSPYPTQLKRLRDIVCSRCSNADIARCVRIKSCRIEALVVCLHEGLQQWPYVLDIITRLAYEPAVRDALLRHDPTLVQNLLVQACKSDVLQPRYAAAAVTILSHPLPENVALPAAAQTLFLRLVDHAAQTPCSDTIRPVHQLLAGISTTLLGLLSHQALAQFQEQLFSILRSSTVRSGQDAEDHYLALYCLAIMRQVTSASEEQLLSAKSLYETQELLASTPPSTSRWNVDSMREFFASSSRGPKTLQLVVLRVLEACRLSSQHSYAASLETLTLANELINAFPVDIRSSWCAANVATVQRLQQKILGSNADCGVYLLALGFVCDLSREPLTRPCRKALAEIFLHAGRFVEASYELDDSVLLRCLPYVLDEATPGDLLQNLVQYIADATSVETVQSSKVLAALLEGLKDHLGEASGGGDSLCLALSDPQLQRQMCALGAGRCHSETTSSRNDRVCDEHLLQSWNRTVHSLTSLLLTAAVTTGQGFSQEVVQRLLELHAGSANVRSTCNHVRAQLRSTFSYVEQAGTPQASGVNWRQTLEHQLHFQVQTSHHSLSTMFAQACASLEARCEGVELPLRQEQEKRTALQDEYDQLSSAYAELEAHSLECNLRLGAIDAEKDRCLAELEQARKEVDEALEKIDSLQESLQQTKLRADAEAEGLQKAREAADLGHATALANKEAQLEESQETVSSLERSLIEKTGALEQVQHDLQDASVAKAALQLEAEDLHDIVREKQVMVDKLKDVLHDAESKHDRLVTERDLLRDGHEESKVKYEQHLQQVKDHGKQNLEAANASHNATMDRLAAQHGEEVADLERKLSDGQAALRRLTEQNDLEAAQRKESMAEMQEIVKQLNRNCKEKDGQIAEANAMRGNLMAAMGLGGIPVPASLPHRTRASAPLTQADDSQMEMSPPRPLQAYAPNTQAFDGRASFASNASSAESRTGPTPKRAKPRKSFKAASPAKARMSTIARTGRASLLGRSTLKRQPLANVNANRSPSKAVPRTPSKAAEIGIADDFDDSTFDENEVYDEMPRRRRLDLENVMDDES